MAAVLAAFERQRLANIARNQEVMRQQLAGVDTSLLQQVRVRPRARAHLRRRCGRRRSCQLAVDAVPSLQNPFACSPFIAAAAARQARARAQAARAARAQGVRPCAPLRPVRPGGASMLFF